MNIQPSPQNTDFFTNYVKETINPKIEKFEIELLKFILLNKFLITKKEQRGRFLIYTFPTDNELSQEQIKKKIEQSIQIFGSKLMIKMSQKKIETLKENNNDTLNDDWQQMFNYIPKLIEIIKETIFKYLDKNWSRQNIIKQFESYKINLEDFLIIGQINPEKLKDILMPDTEVKGKSINTNYLKANANIYLRCYQLQLKNNTNLTNLERKELYQNAVITVEQVKNYYQFEYPTKTYLRVS